MKDMPVFSTEYGVASLTLREIPYTETAYIRVQSTSDADKLLEECVGFCRACGAERIYATGEGTEGYPLHTAIWHMRAEKAGIPESDAALFPVQGRTLEEWRRIYNEKVKKVPNGAWMTIDDGKQMLEKGDGYFVHQDGVLLGIGRVSEDRIDWLASVFPGAGKAVLGALVHAITGDTVCLTVASANEKALNLYTQNGFITTGEISRWYEIFV